MPLLAGGFKVGELEPLQAQLSSGGPLVCQEVELERSLRSWNRSIVDFRDIIMPKDLNFNKVKKQL